MEVLRKIIPANQWQLKCPYFMKPTRIVIHNTANDASAANEIAYMGRNSNEVSFHYAIDDCMVVQGIEENRNTWNAGDGVNGKGNREGISIEICYSKSGGARFAKAEKNAAKFTAALLKKYKWNINKVTKHQDYNGKYCPHRTLDMGWSRFIKMVQSYLIEPSEKPPMKKPTNKPVVEKNEFQIGDVVKIQKPGNANSSGTGATAYGIGWQREILQIVKNSKYPIKVGNKLGVTGYYQKEGLLLMKSSKARVHIVQKGDTMSAIAKKYNTTVKELTVLNKIKNPNIIVIGQTIKIPN